MISKNIFLNFVKTSVTIPLGMLLLFALNIYFARVLGAEDFGRLATVLQWANVIGVLLSLGLPMAAQRLIAHYENIGDTKSNQSYISFVLLYVTSLITIIISLVVWAYIHGMDTFSIGIGICSASCLLWLVQRYFSLGLNNVLFAILPRDVLFPVVMILFVWFFSIKNYENMVVLYGVVLTTICLIALVWNLKLASLGLWPLKIPTLTLIKGWLKTSIPFSVTSFSQLGLNGSEVIVLSFFLSAEDVGTYVLASKLALLCGLITRVLNASVGQTFAKIHSSGQSKEFWMFYKSVACLAALVTLLIVVVYIFYGKEILWLIGPEYASGYVVLLVLVLGHGLAAALGPVIMALNMSANQNYTATVAMISVLVNIALLIVVLPIYGVIGGAAVAAIVLVLARAIQFYFLLVNIKSWV